MLGGLNQMLLNKQRPEMRAAAYATVCARFNLLQTGTLPKAGGYLRRFANLALLI